MIKLRKLTIKGFRSFAEESTLDFTDSGMFLISGTDVRSGASNGSGKSTIPMAIAWMLGFSDIPATQLKNYQSASMEGELLLDVGDLPVKIRRTSTKLEVWENDQPVPGMKDVLQAKIESYIGNTDVFETISYRKQEDRGKFLYTPDSKLKTFLGQCIPDLEKIEVVAENASKAATSLKDQLEKKNNEIDILKSSFVDFDVSHQQRIETLTSEVDSTANQINAIKKLPILSFLDPAARDQLTSLNLQIEELQNPKPVSDTQSINTSEKKLSKETSTQLAEVESYLIDLSKQLTQYDKINFHRNAQLQINAFNATINDIRALERQKELSIIKIKQNIHELNLLIGEIAVLKDSTCPTCVRQWDGAANKAAKAIITKNELKKEILNLKSVVDSSPDYSIQLSDLNAKRESVLAQKSTYDMEIATLESKIKDSLALKSLIIKNELQKQEESIKSKVLQKQSLEQVAKSNRDKSLSILESDLSLKTSELRSMNTEAVRVESFRNRISGLDKEKVSLESKFNMESSISSVLGRQGILGKIFDELLAEIEHESNVLLSEIPNCADITLAIRSSYETKSGTVKSEISTQILKSGYDIAYKALSGGQRSSLSLCADLAMMNAIKKRTNIKPGWIVLDEALDGMDLASKESAIELIRRYAADQLVLVIDHATEIKEMFNGVIEVEYDGKNSRIVQ